MNEFKVGQEVFVVWNNMRHSHQSIETIEKVGRKWISIGGRYRFDPETMNIDGGDYMSPGSVYLSKEEWQREQEISSAWKDFRMKVYDQRSIPADLTVEKINQAIELLGLPITKKIVEVECNGWELRYDLDAAKAAVSLFEIDGWKARFEDFQDSGNYVGETHVKVTFERKV